MRLKKYRNGIIELRLENVVWINMAQGDVVGCCGSGNKSLILQKTGHIIINLK